MRSGTANDLATPTWAGGFEGGSLGTCWREGDEEWVVSYIGNEASGVGLE
jgi:hypothetical protein